jgi:hypothetical protein
VTAEFNNISQEQRAVNNEQYNGWTNYETWNAKLWMDNDQSSYSYWNETAAEAWNETDEDDDAETRTQEAVRVLEDRLESEHEENMPEVRGMYADILRSAMDRINWREIAASLIEDVEKPEPEKQPEESDDDVGK